MVMVTAVTPTTPVSAPMFRVKVVHGTVTPAAVAASHWATEKVVGMVVSVES
jgi:hypothetical protein